jgi:hypothetical protein
MPWIVATGQAWKLKVFYVVILLTLILFGRFILSYNGINVALILGDPRNPALFLAVGFGSLLWVVLSIRCPTCDALPVWTLLRHGGASNWLIELSQSDRCAVCGKREVSDEENRT